MIAHAHTYKCISTSSLHIHEKDLGKNIKMHFTYSLLPFLQTIEFFLKFSSYLFRQNIPGLRLSHNWNCPSSSQISARLSFFLSPSWPKAISSEDEKELPPDPYVSECRI